MKAFLAVAASLVVSLPASGQAQGLSVADFLLKAQALMRAGQAAAESPDLPILREEMVAAGKAVRAQQAADLAAGRPAVYCVPATAAANSTEVIAHLMKIPENRRSAPFREAFADYAKTKYPCPAR